MRLIFYFVCVWVTPQCYLFRPKLIFYRNSFVIFPVRLFLYYLTLFNCGQFSSMEELSIGQGRWLKGKNDGICLHVGTLGSVPDTTCSSKQHQVWPKKHTKKVVISFNRLLFKTVFKCTFSCSVFTFQFRILLHKCFTNKHYQYLLNIIYIMVD